MNSLEADLPALWLFLGAYLHQDWQDDYSSTQEAFRDFLASEPQDVSAIQDELTAVLDSGRDEQALEKLVLDCGSFYCPSRHGIATGTWLAELLEMCPQAPEAGYRS